MDTLSISIAFLAGLVSFLSPCVLPIIPGFLVYLAGSSDTRARPHQWEVFINSFFFVLGFSIVFASLGVLLNTILEAIAYDIQTWLSWIGGIIIIFFGLYLTRLIRVPWLDRDYKFAVTRKFKSRYVTSFLFGVAFAAGWTPCVGAVLGAILALAASNPASSFSLLLAYALGLGVPFLILGIFTAQLTAVLARLGTLLLYVEIGFGIILIFVGVLVFTQTLPLLANFDLVNQIILHQ